MVRMEPVQQIRHRDAILPDQLQQPGVVLLLEHHRGARRSACACAYAGKQGTQSSRETEADDATDARAQA
jgi:hypothetical protein